MPAPGGRMTTPGDRVAHRLAAPVHYRAVDAEVGHCFLASAWRWEASARRQFSLMWQVGSFSSVFARGKLSWTLSSSNNTSWSTWRSASACGNSSIFLFVSPPSSIFHFLSLSSSWQWRAKPIFVGVRCSHWTFMYFRMVWIYICFFHWFLVSCLCI